MRANYGPDDAAIELLEAYRETPPSERPNFFDEMHTAASILSQHDDPPPPANGAERMLQSIRVAVAMCHAAAAEPEDELDREAFEIAAAAVGADSSELRDAMAVVGSLSSGDPTLNALCAMCRAIDLGVSGSKKWPTMPAEMAAVIFVRMAELLRETIASNGGRGASPFSNN